MVACAVKMLIWRSCESKRRGKFYGVKVLLNSSEMIVDFLARVATVAFF